MGKEEYITKEGLEELKKKLDYLKTEKTREIAELIRQTASHGDLKENFAYHDAKDKQAFLQGRIQELEYKIKNAKIIKKTQIDKVQVGSKVKVSVNGEELEFSLVASDQVDPVKGKISYESPLGKVLLNKSRGDEVEINVNDSKIKYKILKIE